MSDDEDDDLLDAPPTFAPTQPSKSQTIDKKPSISNKKKNTNVGDRQDQESRDNATVSEAQLDTVKLPEEAKQTTTVEIQQVLLEMYKNQPKRKRQPKRQKSNPTRTISLYRLTVCLFKRMPISQPKRTLSRRWKDSTEPSFTRLREHLPGRD